MYPRVTSPTYKLGRTWLKAERAIQHLEHLRRRISLIEGDVFSVPEERDESNGDRVWRLAPGQNANELMDVPMYGVIVGDVVHQLRSVLDHAVWQLAKPPIDGRTAFPICLHERDAPGSFFGGTDRATGKRFNPIGTDRLRNVGRAAIDYIESVQPYRRLGVGDPLWALNELWNSDKHRTLIVVADPQWVQPMAIAFPDGRDQFAPGELKEADLVNGEVLRLDGSSTAEVILAVSAPVRIVYGPTAPAVGGKLVLPNLDWMLRSVQEILIGIESFL